MRFDRSHRSTGADAGPSQGRPWRRRRYGNRCTSLPLRAIAACGGSSDNNNSSNVNKTNASYGTKLGGTLPEAGVPAEKSGSITMAQVEGQTPTDIFPIVDGQSCSTQTGNFIAHLYLPLYYGPDGARPEIDYTQGAAEPAGLHRRRQDRLDHDQEGPEVVRRQARDGAGRPLRL